MKLPARLPRLTWLLLPFGALVFIAWTSWARIRRVEFVTQAAQEGAAVDARSPTGWADGRRWLIVPEHHNPTYQWIEETQLMLAAHRWRIRRIAYENAPIGRDVHSASPYRWWLVAVAGLERAVSGHPLALSVERAALFADPLLQALFLVGGTVFVRSRFGRPSACLFAVGVAALYPLAAAYLPGIAGDFGLLQIAEAFSLLFLLAGCREPNRAARWFALSGVAGGCGLWLSAADAAPLLAGAGAGGVLAALALRASPVRPSAGLPWRTWAFVGASTSLAGYLIEYFPGHMEPQLRVNYPLYGIAWIGLGEVVHRLDRWVRTGRPFASAWGLLPAAAGLAALASLPIALTTARDHAFLAGDLLTARLTNLPDGVLATGSVPWLARDGMSGAVVATLAGLLVLGLAAGVALSRGGPARERAAAALALGPSAVAVALAWHQIRWWNTYDALALALIAALAASALPWVRRTAAAFVCVGAAAGVAELLPATPGDPALFRFTRAEIEGLYERALAHWIADHAGPEGATVLLPPLRTSSFCFYGGLRGLGTQNWENRDGLSATFRIVNSTRPDESYALLTERGVTHIVLPSWDLDLDDFARMGLKEPKNSFIYALHQTDGGIFNWLRALPYTLPAVSGFSDQSVLVLAMTDETDPATLRSRLVEYLVEMHRMDQAVFSSQALSKYPADLGALVALAQVAKARGDAAGFAQALDSIVSNLAGSPDRAVAWDRRVSLAVVLALGGKEDLCRAQVERCLAAIDADRLRFLTTGSLYHFLVLLRHFHLGLPDPGLDALSLELLPAELRERLPSAGA
jgi:hypothetical protein